MISAVMTWAFVILVHVQMVNHLSQSYYLQDNYDRIVYANEVATDPEAFA